MQSYIEDAVLGKCSHSSQKTSNKGKERPFDAIDDDSGHGGNQSTESPSKELVLSDPGTSGAGHFNLAVNDHIENDAPSFRNFLAPLSHNSQKISRKGKKRSFHVIDGVPKHGGNQPTQISSNELLLYDPGTSAATDHVENHTPTFRNFLAPNSSSRTFQSIGTFTVQCASCFKWRIIPTKEKYEQIREKILEEPFVCQHAREWRPDIACGDPEDISQDGSRIWAIDKPNIAQPPSGWQRLLRIRGEGGTKFADVYYVAPSGKRLRSMVEVQKYLLEHPEYARHGVTLSQFSFQAPRPLQENYVKKRPARLTSSCDGGDLPLQGPPEPKEVNPLAWAAPDKEFIVGGQASSSPGHTLPASSPPKEPTPPIAVSPLKQMPIESVPGKSKMKPEDKHPRSASSCEL